MDIITLLPADNYKVVNKTVLTDFDRKTLIALYEPIIGPFAISLYFTFWHDFTSSFLFITISITLYNISLQKGRCLWKKSTELYFILI